MSLKKILNFIIHPPIRFRLVFIFTVLFGGFTSLFAGFLYYEVIDTLKEDFDSALYNYTVDVSNSLEYDRSGEVEVSDFKFEQSKVLPFPLGTALIQLRNKRGKILDRQGTFGRFSPKLVITDNPVNRIDEASFYSIEPETSSLIPNAEASNYRLIVFPINSNSNRKLYLEIAVPMRLLEGQIHKRLQFIRWGIPALILISVLGALYFSSRALSPLASIIHIAKTMNPQDLSQRIPIPEADDEIKILIETLNSLFEKIQEAYLSQERFVADASHQLLTPLTIARANIELLASRVSADQQKELTHSLDQIDNLAKIVRQMLILARVDAGAANLSKTILDPDELLFAAVSQTEKYALQKNIQIRLDLKNIDDSEMPKIEGDHDLLIHLLRNLLENAIKYTPNDSLITVQLVWKDKELSFEIKDQGPGIPDEMIDTIFERFHRGSLLNQNTPGFGLGLSIAQKIAKLHLGHIHCSNNLDQKGCTFTFEVTGK